MAQTKILHIKGNSITIGFPIAEIQNVLNDGTDHVNTEFNDILGDVWVVLRRGLLIRQFKVEANANYISFTDHGHLPCGEYDIELYYDHELLPMRYAKEKMLVVVNTTEEGQVYQSTDFDVIAYYPVINGRESAIVIGDGYVRLIAGNGLRADIDEDSVNLRAGYGNSTVEVTENNVNININD